MALSHDKGEEGVAAGGPVAPSSPTYTVYECVYPDTDRRRSGESEEDAVSRAYFLTRGDADAFQSHNGGSVQAVALSLTQKRLLQNQGKIPGMFPGSGRRRHHR